MNATREIWKSIPGWDGLYEVSDRGQVRSVDRRDSRGVLRRGRIRALEMNPQGYLFTVLYDKAGGRRTGYNVHRLVAQAFIGERTEGQVIRHLNDDKTDNRLENLSYGSYSANAYEAVDNGKQFPAYRDACKNGHEYTAGNTRYYTSPKGYTMRRCKTCVTNYSRAAEARRKAKANAGKSPSSTAH